MKRKLVIFGLGDIAELAAYLFDLHTDYEVAAFTVNKEYMTSDRFMNKPVIDFDRVVTACSPQEHDMFVAIGYRDINKAREEKYNEAKALGYRLARYVSPFATVFDNVAIGDNCFIFEHNVLQPFVRIGNNTILWSGNHIGHHTTIGDHCFITSHAVISGRVRVGNNSFIGVNATLRDHLVIGNHCVIGAGAVLLKDAEDGQVFVAESTPASSVPSHRLRNI
ncbi:MAG: acetyltransferase [Alphaproteobacteria bacterium]